MDYRDTQRSLQDRFDTRRLADRLGSVAGPDLTPFRDWIQARNMFFLATADGAGQPQCSYKGGDPGFVQVTGPSTLSFPTYDGNGMFLSLGNIAENPAVGLLFVDFGDGSRLRVTGTAGLQEGAGGLPSVEVRVDAVFPNCRRYVHTGGPSRRSEFVPVPGQEPPVPDWKRDAWFAGTLPEHDPARDPARPAAPATPQF